MPSSASRDNAASQIGLEKLKRHRIRFFTLSQEHDLFDASAALYDHALKLWEHLSQTLNYNVMFSPRGVMMLAHTVTTSKSFSATSTPTASTASTTNG